MSQLSAGLDLVNGDVSVVLLWQESFIVTGSVVDGVNTKYAVGDNFPGGVGATGYRFNLPDGFRRFVATLTGTGPGGTDLDLYLTRLRRVVAASTGSGQIEQIIFGDMPAGVYELWAYGHTVVPLSVGYTITVTGDVPVHVSRVYPDGTTAEVLGSPVIPGTDDGYATLWDTVGPLNVPVYYRATEPLTNVSLTSNTVTVTGQGDGWLRDPIVPSNDVHLTDCSIPCSTPTPNLGGGVTQVLLDTFSRSVASDTFTRSVSNGLGTADSGQVWTVFGPPPTSDFLVTGTAAWHSISTIAVDYRSTLAVSVLNGSVVVDATTRGTTSHALGAGIAFGTIMRFTDINNYYQLYLVVQTDDTIVARIDKFVGGVFTALVSATIGLTAAGSIPRMRLRTEVIGSTLRMRAWLVGNPEPSTWDLTATDASLATSSGVGLFSHVNAGNTNTLPIIIEFDNLTVCGGPWGPADTGQAATIRTGSGSDFFTDCAQGQILLSAVNVEKLITYGASVASGYVQLDVRAPAASGAPINAYAVARFTDVNNYYRARLVFGVDHTLKIELAKVVGGVTTVIEPQVTQPGVFHIPDAFYRLGFDLDGGVLRAKVWQRGTPEPTDWTIVTNDTSITSAGEVGVRAFLSVGNLNALPVMMSFDNVTVTTFAVPSLVGPDVDRRAVFQSIGDLGYASASGVFQVVGGSRPRTVAQVRRGPHGTLVLLTQTLAQAKSVRNLLASGRTLFAQIAAAYGFAYDTWAADYVDVIDATERRVSGNVMTYVERSWDLPVTFSRAPAVRTGRGGGNGLGPVGKTYLDEVASSLTYQDESSGTYLQASIGQVA